MRIFLDIGSHVGETVLEVVKPKYAFDRIVCFEPASACWPDLEQLAAADPRIEICRFGLSDANCQVELHNAGSLGGSIFATEGPVETIELRDAAEWFDQNLDPDDFIVVKTNCEGGEIDIVNRLLDKGRMHWAVTFLITPDIRDYPEHRHKEITLRRRLAWSGFANFCFSDNVMFGETHQAGIGHWLGLFGVDRSDLSKAEVRRLYDRNFRRFARKTGRWQRIERLFKERARYDAFPEPMKNLLRSAKRALGMN